MGEPDQLLSILDVAHHAGISVNTVYRRVRDGALPIVSGPGPVRIRRADLLTWMTTPAPVVIPPELTPAAQALVQAEAIARFWARVDKGGDCWLWTGAAIGNGYGVLIFCGVRAYAHRLAYELTYGPFLPGLFVCHHCDNPRCVRPDHLFLGTAADNSADMVRKGRTSKTRKPYTRRKTIPNNAKLTADQAAQIRTLYTEGKTQKELAALFGVSHTTIHMIVKDKVWKCGEITRHAANPDARRIAELEAEVSQLRKALEEASN